LAVPGIRDTQCGFKLFTRDCARAVFPYCFLNGWSFDVEVIYLARRMGFKPVEVPIHWSHKEGSKVSPLMDGLRTVRDTMKIKFHHYDFGDADRAI
jgi:dolichyl-phosphate beta-glucosyltransferase